MKILKVAALSAVFAAQFAFAQFKQTPLPYAYNALEGNIDAQTMEIHYSKHAAAYVANLNKAIAGTPQEKQTLFEIMSNASKLPAAVRNNAGGHYNHELFWTVLTPEKIHSLLQNWQKQSMKLSEAWMLLKKKWQSRCRPFRIRMGMAFCG
jgi:Fe-Mn family superoxide dismutase